MLNTPQIGRDLVTVPPSLFDDEQLLVSTRRSRLSKASRNGETIVLWNGHYAVVSYHEDNDVSRRSAAVFLLQTKLGTYAEVAVLLEYSESMLYVIMRQYRDKGLLGLFKQKTGPRTAKITPEIRQYILTTKGVTQNEMILHIGQEFGTSLTQPMIHHVKQGNIHAEQEQWFTDDLLQSLMAKKSDSDGSTEREKAEQKKEEAPNADSIDQIPDSVTTPLAEPEELPVSSGNSAAVPVLAEIRSDGDSMEQRVAVLDRGADAKTSLVSSRYAGGFLLQPFLTQIDPSGLFRQAQDTCGKTMEWCHHGYGLYRLMTTLIFLLWFRFSSIEDFKFVQPQEFGVLLGGNRAPSVKTLRRSFRSLLDEDVIDSWMLQLVRRYIQLDVIQLGTLYFDGHKIPYYGHTDLPKGYLSSRRLPAKLIQQVFANDRSGRPVFLRVHDTSLSFKETVLGMIEDALELWKERGIRAPLVVAFDRELYDTNFFATLDEMGVLYITWRKWDTAVPIERLTEEIRTSGAEASEVENDVLYRVWRRSITVKEYVVEAISFLSTEKAKADPNRTPSTLVTNVTRFTKQEFPDFEPLATKDIIETLCGRWGQENYFRYSKHGERLDYIPGYETRGRQEERFVSNPQIKELGKELKSLRKEVERLNTKIANKLIARKKKNKPLEEILQQKGIQAFTQQREQTQTRMDEIQNELSSLSPKVQVQTEDPSLELALEGKLFLDVLRIAMHNAEQMLLDVFKRCYSDPRDMHKVLRAIAEQGGVVEEGIDTITVWLSPLHIPTHRRATEKLCVELTAMEATMAGTEKKLLFAIQE
jgi:transposase